MNWFSRHTHWLYSEAQALSNSSIYKEHFQFIDKTFVSAGSIIVHKEKTNYYPILIVYPDATPYVAPTIYVMKTELDVKTVRQFSTQLPGEIREKIQNKVDFFERRHQNQDGSICFLEAGDLHSENAEAYPISDILKRVRSWLAGKIPVDSSEIELFAHFRQRTQDLQYLLPDIFFDTGIVKGKYYAALSGIIPGGPHRTYIGTVLIGENVAGIAILPKVYVNEGLVLFAPIPDLKKVMIDRNYDAIEEEKKKGNVIEGRWWDINQEPEPFSTANSLAKYIANGAEREGVDRLIGVLDNQLKALENNIHIGLRFPGRHREKDWQMLVLKRQARPPVVNQGLEELRERLLDYTVEAVHQEYLTEEYFHLRNRGRADRAILKQKELSMIGCGALGSETADALSKAGVGKLALVDKEVMKAHNTVRHCLGTNRAGFPKVLGMYEFVYLHNPFVEMEAFATDILFANIESYVSQGAVGVSTIADDNVEAYLNEEAVNKDRTVFYCRGLRGGKAARIYRVIPHKDACKTCLSLYRRNAIPIFIDIEEDEHLPVITNECNNPVRSASAADIKTIAGVFARVIIDFLQGEKTEMNHWIWNTESLKNLRIDSPIQAQLSAWTIPPYPNCPTCNKLEETRVNIDGPAYDFIKKEAAASKDVETGGVLLGHRARDGRYLILRATGPGPNALRTVSRFEKDTEYCQQEIEKAFHKLGDYGLYLGEWHYHPIGGASPSGTDIKSLTEIAAQDNYRIDKPIMIILSPSLECAITIHDESGRCITIPLEIIPTQTETEYAR